MGQRQRPQSKVRCSMRYCAQNELYSVYRLVYHQFTECCGIFSNFSQHLLFSPLAGRIFSLISSELTYSFLKYFYNYHRFEVDVTLRSYNNYIHSKDVCRTYVAVSDESTGIITYINKNSGEGEIDHSEARKNKPLLASTNNVYFTHIVIGL